MNKVKINNLVKLYALLLLNTKPKHGYEIIKDMEIKINKRISPGEIYPFFKLLKKNRIVSEKIENRRKVYRLTKKGKIFVKKMLERFGNLIDIAIKPNLISCYNCGCKIYKKGYKEKIKGKYLNFCCIYCAKSYKKFKI